MFEGEQDGGPRGGSGGGLPGAGTGLLEHPAEQERQGAGSLVTETGVPSQGPLGRARVALAAAAAEAAALPRVPSGQLPVELSQAWRVRAEAEQVAVRIALEAADRGLHLDKGMSLYDWLTGLLPWACVREVADLVVLCKHAGAPGNTPVRQAVTEGGLPPRRAARLLRCLEKVRPALPHASDPDPEDPEAAEEGSYQGAVRLLLGVAADPDHTDADLAKVTDRLLEVALPEHTRESKERTLRQQRGINESSLADGSLTRFVITAEPEGAALLQSVLTSPLAAPAPDADGPDPRTAAQRRYDALMTVIGRGMTSPDGVPTTTKATMVITLPFDVLAGQLASPGHTMTGETLGPDTIRKLACQAEIIPMVLGTDSEVLDQGRAVRTATRGQLVRLWHRDQHCSYPGCTVPPHWCHAHHLRWWSRHGPTDIDNLALVCPRHHTLIHERDLTATITTTGLRWHPR